MYGNLGFFLCLLSLFLCIHSIFSATLSQKLQNYRLTQSSIKAINFSMITLIIAAALFIYMSIKKDYAIDYIFKNSSNDLPTFYAITSFWSSLQGSHFLWSIIIGLISLIAIHTSCDELKPYKNYLMIFVGSILIWMYFLLISFSDPFIIKLPKPENGLGMNALLQNPYMIIHPPILFLGYSSLIVPFAYAMAALCHGKTNSAWLKIMKLWSVISWTFLTLGIFLGGRWAYVELGWGGYWAWDPVENSSLIPWILVTALIHGLIIQSKISHSMAKLNILLAIFALFFSFFGTFLTRSGILNSVHSFAQSDVGEIYLIYLVLLLITCLTIYILRADRITLNALNKNNNSYLWSISKELYIFCGIILLLVFAGIVALGTLYPIFSEIILKVRLNVQAPYFNAFAPWIGLTLSVIMALASVTTYFKNFITIKYKHLLLLAIISLITSCLFAYGADLSYSNRWRFAIQFVATIIVFLTINLSIYELRYKFKKSKKSLKSFTSSNLSAISSCISHIGVMIAILGFLGNYQSMHTNLNLAKNIPQTKFGYTFEYHGIDQTMANNAVLYQAAVSVTDNHTNTSNLLSPGRSKYPNKDELLHEVAVFSYIWKDIYLVLIDYGSNINQGDNFENITLGVYINPLIKWVWLAVWILIIGGILSIFCAIKKLYYKY